MRVLYVVVITPGAGVCSRFRAPLCALCCACLECSRWTGWAQVQTLGLHDKEAIYFCRHGPISFSKNSPLFRQGMLWMKAKEKD